MNLLPFGLALAAAAFLPAHAASPADPAEGSCAATAGPAISVDVTGLKDSSGRMKLELYPANEGDFLKDDRDLLREGKVFRRAWGKAPASGTAHLCIRAPTPGRYALVFTHDRDGRNKFNVWQDGVGTASNQPIGRSRPKVGQAIVDVPAGGAKVTIRVQYLRGMSGFAPAAAR